MRTDSGCARIFGRRIETLEDMLRGFPGISAESSGSTFPRFPVTPGIFTLHVIVH